MPETGAERSKVLIIHYYFPPRGGVAVQRVVKLCKYLGEFGCDPIVLTSGAEYASFRDSSLLAEIPETVKVYGTAKKKSIEGQFGRRNIFLDAFLPWVPEAVRKGNEIIRRHGVHVVLTTSPPHSQQLTGLWLRMRRGLPWIADFRDPWTSDHRFTVHKKGWPLRIERLLEKRVLRKADAVVATSPGAVESFAEKTGGGGREKFLWIPNGYDPDDYGTGRKAPGGPLTLTYAGSTGPYISDPSGFLRAVRALLHEEESLRERIRVRFVGAADGGVRKLVTELGLRGVVEMTGNLPHGEAVRAMEESDVLLLFEVPVREGHPTRVIPSKIFEYMGARKPVLAVAAEGDTACLVRDHGLGDVLAPGDLSGLRRTLRDYVRRYEEGRLALPGPPPAGFSRREQARRVAGLIHDLRNGLSGPGRRRGR